MKILNLALRIIRQFKRDKRSLALIFVVPLVILWLFSIILISGEKEVTIGLINIPKLIEENLKNNDVDVIVFESQSEALKLLEKGKIDAYIELDQEILIIKLEGSDIGANKEVLTKVQESIKQNTSTMTTDISFLYGAKDLNMFDTIGPAFLGFFAFFFVFILSGISFVRERLSGTLERLLVSPINRIEIVLGYVIGFGIFAVIQSILITFFTVYILDMYSIGSLINVIIVTCLISMSALTIGTFISAFANNEFQVMQFIPIVIIPQMFFTGLFPVDNLPIWLSFLGKLFPLTYGSDILRNVMFKGEGLLDNLASVTILLLFSVLFIVFNMMVLRKQKAS